MAGRPGGSAFGLKAVTAWAALRRRYRATVPAQLRLLRAATAPLAAGVLTGRVKGPPERRQGCVKAVSDGAWIGFAVRRQSRGQRS